MRAYFRVAPNFGVSFPWWIAIPLLICWVALAVTFWLAVLCWWIVTRVAVAGHAGWRSLQAKRGTWRARRT